MSEECSEERQFKRKREIRTDQDFSEEREEDFHYAADCMIRATRHVQASESASGLEISPFAGTEWSMSNLLGDIAGMRNGRRELRITNSAFDWKRRAMLSSPKSVDSA